MAKYIERDEIMEREEWGADGFLTTWSVLLLMAGVFPVALSNANNACSF